MAETSLIHALRDAPRASISSLADRIGLSRGVTAQHLHRLLETGAIRVIGEPNPAYLGATVIGNVSIATRGPIDRICALAMALEDVVFVAAISGEYNLIVEMRVASTAALRRRLNRFREFPEVIGTSGLIYSQIVRGGSAGQGYTPIEIDDHDRLLMQLLQYDGRMGYRALADAVGLSPSAIRVRLDRLLMAKVLAITVVESRGFSGSRVTMGMGLGLAIGHENVIELLRTAPYVDFAAETIGAYDALVTVSAPSLSDLYQLDERLRVLPSVTRVTSWIHMRSIKESYPTQLPRENQGTSPSTL